MEVNRIFACVAIFLMLFLLLPIYSANCQDYIEYKVHISSNGSAGWLITKVSDVNAPIDSWDTFQTRIYDLVDYASNLTGRQMDIDDYSLQINTTISAASKITEYMFIWQNFSTIQNGELVFGDVFGVNGFFDQLYGEASLQIEYPDNYVVQSAIPEPNLQDDSAHMLRWYTQELTGNQVSVTLEIQSNGSTQNGISEQYIILGVASIIVIAALLTGFLIVKRRKGKAKVAVKEATMLAAPLETEEDKILNTLRSGGNSMRQSDITEQCRFSKAKTSQLLASLEKRGIIRRYKKGRDKIVTLNESGKGE